MENEIGYKIRSTVSMTSDSESDAAKKALGSVYTEHQHQGCDNSWMTLAILFSLKTMESLKNGLQPYSGMAALFFNENSITSVIAELLQR